MGASKDNLKQVIKIYKESIKDETSVNGVVGYQSTRISQNIKDSNGKSSLIGNMRNMSVPRGTH